jgi:5-methylcytosine-specific restriction endonuclease McrA
VSAYCLSHLSDSVLLRDLAALVARDRATTAALLAHLAEVDARKLYLPAAYPSMFSYCVGELKLSEESAFKRIRVARTARRFPAIFDALAEGRLHLSAVVMLAPYLTETNADELLAAAACKTKPEIEQLLAERFPRPEMLAWVQALAPPLPPGEQLAPGPVGSDGPGEGQLAPERVGSYAELSAPARIETPAPRAKLAPVAPERYALQLTIGKSTHDKLQYAKALLSHQIPAGEIAEVLDRALDALIGQLERRMVAATPRPRPRQRRSSANPRYIPAEVKRAVWERDGGQCTFVSEAGRRCPARKFLEFDHSEPVARGGRATVANMRLRCRSHNQYGAERTFGTGFMSHKRQQAREAAERAQAAAEVIPWLRALGFRADEARRAAAACESLPEAPLEQRVRVALSGFAKPPHGRTAWSPQTAM